MENYEELMKKINTKIGELEYEIGKDLLNKEGDLTKEEQIKFANALLKCTDKNIDKEIIDLSDEDPSLDAIYLCVKGNDGKEIIVDSKKEIYVANASYGFEKLLQGYKNGERTVIEIEPTKDELINKINNSISELEEKVKVDLLNKEGDLTKEEQISLGKAILKCSNSNIEKSIIDLSEKDPSLDAVYIGIKDRGGNAIIVNSKKEYLTATSAVNFERHVEEFKNGRRTNN